MALSKKSIPRSLRIWFVIHFLVDLVFAIPLLFFPQLFMGLLGWEYTDPVTTRIVGAALLGIGGESFLGRNASNEVFLAMLNLKIIWAAGAVLGIFLGIRDGAPSIARGILLIFATFLGVWLYYRVQLRESN